MSKLLVQKPVFRVQKKKVQKSIKRAHYSSRTFLHRNRREEEAASTLSLKCERKLEKRRREIETGKAEQEGQAKARAKVKRETNSAYR